MVPIVRPSIIPILVLSLLTFLLVPSAASACSRCVCEYGGCHCDFSFSFTCVIGPSEDACAEYWCGGGGPQGELRQKDAIGCDAAVRIAQATHTQFARTGAPVKRQVVRVEELRPRT